MLIVQYHIIVYIHLTHACMHSHMCIYRVSACMLPETLPRIAQTTAGLTYNTVWCGTVQCSAITLYCPGPGNSLLKSIMERKVKNKADLFLVHIYYNDLLVKYGRLTLSRYRTGYLPCPWK